MLNLEDDDFIREYRNSRFHRFREIERFALLDKKFSKYQSQADIPVRFDILKQINLEEKLNERIRENR